MRVLLLTDTHGRIDEINAFSAEYKAQACIHCGDIGLFDSRSIRKMPSEELKKIIRHAAVSADEKVRVCALSQAEMAEFLLKNNLAGTFEDYLSGRKKFEVPTFAVWGNHEDISIVEQLRKKPLKNFTFLDENNSVLLENVRFYGVGGDFHEKHLPMSGKTGIPWVKNQIKSAFWQYRKLVNMLDQYPMDETRVQITHCDPAEVPFLPALAYRCGAVLSCSGHMHRKEILQWQSRGTAEEAFADYIQKYPGLAWQEMIKSSQIKTVRHLNLPCSVPLVLEIVGSEIRVLN